MTTQTLTDAELVRIIKSETSSDQEKNAACQTLARTLDYTWSPASQFLFDILDGKYPAPWRSMATYQRLCDYNVACIANK